MMAYFLHTINLIFDRLNVINVFILKWLKILILKSEEVFKYAKK